MSQKVDAKEFDVIIIGAGPAGGQVARDLSKFGRKVLLIERSQEIGQPNYSTAGTPKETINEFKLPQNVLSSEWDTLIFATPRNEAKWKYPTTAGYVLDFAALKKFLAVDAARNGAEVLVGTSVENIIDGGARFDGVAYHGALGDGKIRGKIIVDATGHNEFANSKLHINPQSNEMLANAMEYVMTNVPKKLERTLAFYVGSEYANQGYSWVFPMNSNRDAKVGTCSINHDRGDKQLEQIQKKFIDNLNCFENMEPIEIHAGAARVDGGVNDHVHKNLILIGDAAHQVNPLAGEGIRHGMKAGRLAAQVIHEWLNGDQKLNTLKTVYENKWEEMFGKKWRFIAKIVRDHIMKFSDNQWDDFVKFCAKIEPNDFYKIFFFYDLKILLKYPSIAAILVKNRISTI